MVIVKKQKGESDDHLIIRFRKQVQDSGLLDEVRDRVRHKKESEKRKEKNYRLAHIRKIEKLKNL